MPTSKRDARFLRRMCAMMIVGVTLLVIGALLNPR
jgi:hypothetical protein